MLMLMKEVKPEPELQLNMGTSITCFLSAGDQGDKGDRGPTARGPKGAPGAPGLSGK